MRGLGTAGVVAAAREKPGSELAALEQVVRGVELLTGWDDLQESLGLQGAQRILERVEVGGHNPTNLAVLRPGPINASTLVVHDRNPGLRLKISVLRRTNASTFAGSADAGYIDSARYIVAGHRRALDVVIAAGWRR